VRLTTWNVNSLRARQDHLLKVIEAYDPDVLCLQELKLTDEQFPAELLRARLPHLAWWGQAGYNGVAILSKHPLTEVQRGFVGWDDPAARALSAEVHGIRLYAVYVPNGSAVGSPKFHYKLRWLGQLRAELDRHDPGRDLAVLGDFNVAPDDLDVWDPFKCDGELLFHPDERSALRKVTDWGLLDAFREKSPYASEFSWWDYQKLSFVRNHGLRIDLALVSRSLMSRVGQVTLHREARGWDQPSDHVPVSVDLR
jgi:exodeoxyribonuclease-3